MENLLSKAAAHAAQRRSIVWITILVVLNLIPTASAEPQSSKPKSAPRPVETKTANPLWKRIVMVGASASAGFTETEPFGGPITAQLDLSRYVEAGLLVPHEPVNNIASPLFFMQPEEEGQRQITEALETNPTLILAIDFLFWFSYGESSTDAESLSRFEQGLKLLEGVRCPLVLGDIPDASAAANTMLPPEFIPSASILSAHNKRLKAWAASRKHVVVVSLSSFMRAALAGQPFKIHGQSVTPKKPTDLLQRDKLHPNTRGCAALAMIMFEALESRQPRPFTGEVRWGLNEVWQIGSGALTRTSDKPQSKQ